MGAKVRSQRAPRESKPKKISKAPQTTSQTRHKRFSLQIRKDNAAKVGFGDLPAELRNQIYAIALKPSSGHPIRIVQHWTGHAGRDLALGLLCSCKAVRKEALYFLYELNEFRIDCFQFEIRATPKALKGSGGKLLR